MNDAGIIVVGGGLSGMITGILLARHDDVKLITKTTLTASNSNLAQGGMACAIGEHDHWFGQFLDTMRAGAGHCRSRAVRHLVQEGKKAFQLLKRYGVSFDRDENGEWLFAHEGAHRCARILHANKDATGAAFVSAIRKRLKQVVEVEEHCMMTDLCIEKHRCLGVFVLRNNGEHVLYRARCVVLAAGGGGQLYNVTSNDRTATADAIAAAWRAGVALGDLEFIQFHPTLLINKEGKGIGLISEAVRGAGGKLVTEDGKRLMEGVHRDKDLAPRDVVARSIELARKNGKNVYLDLTDVKDFEQNFPTIAATCENAGIDWRDGIVPVAPGAHYLMGGVLCDENGRTNVSRLYTVGEAACSGVHGANRLAGNSLLETVVFSQRAAEAIAAEEELEAFPSQYVKQTVSQKTACGRIPVKAEIQKMMSQYCGIVREQTGLKCLLQWCEEQMTAGQGKISFEPKRQMWERKNMLEAARLISASALARTESRGAHFLKDVPERKSKWQKVILVRRGEHIEPIKMPRKNQIVFT